MTTWLLAMCCTGTALATASHADLLQHAQQLRDAKQWDAALALYRQGQQHYPHELQFVWGEIYALADGGHAEEAMTRAQTILASMPKEVDALLVAAYAQLRLQGVFAALQYVDQAMQHTQGQPYVLREYVRALQNAGLPEAALAIAQQQPQLLSPLETWVLQADVAAQRVRLTDLPSPTEAERFAIADRTLAYYDTLFQQWQQAGDSATPVVTRARIDRLQALHARYRMQELIQEYEALQALDVAIPSYILLYVASAYLYEKQPEKAAALYEQLLHHADLRSDEHVRQLQDQGWLYALSDQGAVDTSQHTAAQLEASYAPWRHLTGDHRQVPNPVFLDMQHTAAMMDLYANATPQAQQKLEHMLHSAPSNNSLRTDLANLYRIRGWPRLAEQTYKIAESYDPRALNVQVGQGLTALDLQEWEQAQALSADTLQRFPEDRRAQRLARLWQVHRMAELRIGAYKGLSHNNPVSGGRDLGIEASWYSQPLATFWRLVAGSGHRQARYADGKAQLNFSRLGLEWRSRDWTILGELTRNHFGHGGRTGAGLRLDYHLSDQWSLHTSAQWRSRDTNVNALRANISSNVMELGLQWRHSERRTWRLSLMPGRFSDGNRRWDLLLQGVERVWTQPKWYVDAGLEVFTTRNRRSDVPYYSPRRETSVLPSLTWHHTLLRRYETIWTQHVSAGVGMVQQSGHGRGGITSVSYGQRYQANDVLSLGATLSHLTRPYDGQREREWRVVFDMSIRF